MKIYHISDTHGSGFWEKPLPNDADVVVHTGDLLPNISRGIVSKEINFQSAWISKFSGEITQWLNGRPLIYVPGNHDYVELKEFFPCHRANAEPLDMLGKKWVGIREIPWIRGEWAGELHAQDMARLIYNLFDYWSNLIVDERSGILLSHSPPAGILDKSDGGFVHYGISALSNALQYNQHNFAAVLFGHVHLPHFSQQKILEIIFSNAADNPGGMIELP
jgi:predicted phosphodiesterase